MRALLIASPFLALALYGVASKAAGGDGLMHWTYTSDEASGGGSSGPQSTRNFAVGKFDAVALEGSDEVRVVPGAAMSVSATGPAADLDKLDIRVEGNALKIGRKKGNWSVGWRNSRGVVVTVTTPTLLGAAVNGSGDMTVDQVDTETFQAAVKGSGNLDLTSVKAKRVEFAVDGSGNLNASGTTDSAQIAVGGSGDFDANGFTATRAQIAVRGSGNASMSVSGDAAIAVSGSGDVDVQGTDRCTINKSGSGEANCRL
jgi:Putative auto-transporter adhesin, head GIN domain